MGKPRVKLGPIPEGYHLVDPSMYLPLEEDETIWKSLLDFEFEGDVRWKLSNVKMKRDGYIHPTSMKILYFELESDIVMLRLLVDRDETKMTQIFTVDEISKLERIKRIAYARKRIKQNPQ